MTKMLKAIGAIFLRSHRFVAAAVVVTVAAVTVPIVAAFGHTSLAANRGVFVDDHGCANVSPTATTCTTTLVLGLVENKSLLRFAGSISKSLSPRLGGPSTSLMRSTTKMSAGSKANLVVEEEVEQISGGIRRAVSITEGVGVGKVQVKANLSRASVRATLNAEQCTIDSCTAEKLPVTATFSIVGKTVRNSDRPRLFGGTFGNSP